MSYLCKPLLPCGRLSGLCCIFVCRPRKQWNHTERPSCLHLRGHSLRASAVKDKKSTAQESPRPWTTSIGETIKESSHARHLHIVLFSPQIAGNTGSIARTCAAASVGLHLIEPLGFKIDDAKLKRAGLDYWPYVFVKVHSSWRDFMEYFKQQEGEKRLVAFTKRGTCLYTDKEYKSGDWLVFGSEISGLSTEALADCADEQTYGGGKVRIPMLDTYVRSLNLAVSVGVGLYEALRQLNVLRNMFDETAEEASEEGSEELTLGEKLDMEPILSAVES